MDESELFGEGELSTLFCEALEKDGEGVIAVASWEKGACNYLRLDDGTGVQIVCNLNDPRCDPREIETLVARNFKVWTNPRLQAALYVTPSLAIVGSHNIFCPNASVDDKSRKQWIEAYAVNRTDRFIEHVQARVHEIMHLEDTKQVKKANVAQAKVDRSRFSMALYNLPDGHSIFEAAREQPDLFERVHVAAYERDLDTEAQKLLAENKGEVAADLKLAQSDHLWGYQFEGLNSGDWVIDLSLIATPPVVEGTAFVLGHTAKTQNGGKLNFAIPSPIDVGGQRYRLSIQDKAALSKVARIILKEAKGGLLPLTEAVRIMDESSP